MRYDNIQTELQKLAFDYFYWFSRFEFALKENGKIKRGYRNSALADWSGFTKDYEKHYRLDNSAKKLMENPPEYQVVENKNHYKWVPVSFDHDSSELSRIILIIKTIRNNLFHGGKHGADGWDNPDRVKYLLGLGISVLNSLANMADYEADYLRRY